MKQSAHILRTRELGSESNQTEQTAKKKKEKKTAMVVSREKKMGKRGCGRRKGRVRKGREGEKYRGR